MFKFLKAIGWKNIHNQWRRDEILLDLGIILVGTILFYIAIGAF